MTTIATLQKREDLMTFIRRQLISEPAVQAIVGIGSIANGSARADSDIDAIVFLDPFDWYVIPAEFVWCLADDTFHSIFSQVPGIEQCTQFDFARYDLAQWVEPSFEWPEARRSELRNGWLAYDRTGTVAELIETRTTYTDSDRIARLDQHLSGDGPRVRWETLGPAIAHDRLQAAYFYLVQAIFAYNRAWRPWRNREMSSLLELSWLPDNFAERVLRALGPTSPDYAGYLGRVESLHGLFQEIMERLTADGDYGKDVVGEAFVRSHDEPGRAWNMDEWNRKHAARYSE